VVPVTATGSDLLSIARRGTEAVAFIGAYHLAGSPWLWVDATSPFALNACSGCQLWGPGLPTVRCAHCAAMHALRFFDWLLHQFLVLHCIFPINTASCVSAAPLPPARTTALSVFWCQLRASWLNPPPTTPPARCCGTSPFNLPRSTSFVRCANLGCMHHLLSIVVVAAEGTANTVTPVHVFVVAAAGGVDVPPWFRVCRGLWQHGTDAFYPHRSPSLTDRQPANQPPLLKTRAVVFAPTSFLACAEPV
jgi:hypothetical protein